MVVCNAHCSVCSVCGCVCVNMDKQDRARCQIPSFMPVALSLHTVTLTL